MEYNLQVSLFGSYSAELVKSKKKGTLYFVLYIEQLFVTF